MFYVLFIMVAMVSYAFGFSNGYGTGLATGLDFGRHARMMISRLIIQLAVEKEKHHGTG